LGPCFNSETIALNSFLIVRHRSSWSLAAAVIAAARRRALWRGVALLVAAAFAASVPSRAAAALAMAVQDAHVASQAMECASHHQSPSHSGMPMGACCTCCGPTCEGCASPAAPPVSAHVPTMSLALAAPGVSNGAVLPARRVQFRQPLPIGPPTAPVT
jgi:hypothetical protein